MRVLAIGNLYPPHHLGGYELVWQSAMRRLREAGHEVRVLASDHEEQEAGGEEDPDVHRELRWYWQQHRFPRVGVSKMLAIERHNARVLDRHVEEFQPDVVTWWAMGGMSLSMIERVRRAGTPAVGFVHDDWMVYGPRVDRWIRRCRRLPGPVRAALERVTRIPVTVDLAAAGRWIFVSEHTRRTAMGHLSLSETDVAHSGIDLSIFHEGPPHPWSWSLLYVGRLDPRKGTDTAIEALAHLAGHATLSLVGGGDGEHRQELESLAKRHRVAGGVIFARAGREALPTIYSTADAVLFPTKWDEPWGLVPLEAMAMGVAVVATGTGGSGEYLRDGENCLLVPPGDAEAVAAALERLAGDADLRARLREGGLSTAHEHGEERFNQAVLGAVESTPGTAERITLAG